MESLQTAKLVPDPSRLAPEDAYYRRSTDGTRKRLDRVRKKGQFKKLLWIRQPYPDNYTDEETFLDHLQRNPRLRPYEFWRLMVETTVVVQHIASVAIFCCCFAAIVQQRVSPVTVVSWASVFTVLGWALWDHWMGQEEAEAARAEESEMMRSEPIEERSTSSSDVSKTDYQLEQRPNELTPAQSGFLVDADASTLSGVPNSELAMETETSQTFGYHPPYMNPPSSLSPRNQQRLATAKSALLIYAALLGLSPILKSLTMSTTSDSIWALSTWLLCMNVAFFDYSGGTGAHLPASISTNSALMASTVLASRLKSTTHVFSLTLFSIEVFGLFPIFRRHLRSISPRGHLLLTIVLVTNACGGVFVTLTGGGKGAWLAGVILGSTITFLIMGLCSWRLIGLQQFKNEIHGPWDQARPILRRH